jgi:hypothetical protein
VQAPVVPVFDSFRNNTEGLFRKSVSSKVEVVDDTEAHPTDRSTEAEQDSIPPVVKTSEDDSRDSTEILKRTATGWKERAAGCWEGFQKLRKGRKRQRRKSSSQDQHHTHVA